MKELIVKRDKYKVPLRVRLKFMKQEIEVPKTDSAKNKMKTFKSHLASKKNEWQSENERQTVACVCETGKHVLPEELVLEEIRDGERFIFATVMESGRFRLTASRPNYI